MKRREFCIGSLSAALALWLPQVSVAGAAGRIDDIAILADRLLQVYAERGSAEAVGRAYLRGLSSHPSLEGIVAELLNRLETSPSRLGKISPPDLHTRLVARTTADFETGRTLEIAGWVLGETEAAMCCLAALRADS